MSTISTFKELLLTPALERAIEAMGFKEPTPIQAQAIPVGLARRDMIGCAQTGTGKTAAFCIPMVARLAKLPRATALILVPTREIAAQIDTVLKKLTTHCPELRPTLLIGGMALKPQLKALLNTPRIVVATPGRLCDHLRRGTNTAEHGVLVIARPARQHNAVDRDGSN